ncbi:MAG: alpha/beta hydrolase [Bacteroidetes bacterium]|nr:alpha/beta hydrolase [Bacteroidota bacterium]
MNAVRKFVLVLIFTTISFYTFSQYEKVESNGLDIYYRIIGTGEPILILGGGPGDNSNRYVSLCEILSIEFQCILVDQRGTGKSTPTVQDSTTISIELTFSDFEAIRKNLNLESWNVLGFSYGGYLASLYAHFYPSSVSKLILLGSIGLNANVFSYFNDNINAKLCPTDIEQFEYWSDSTRNAKDPHHALVERIRARMPGYFYDKEKSKIISKAMQDADFNFSIGQLIWSDVIKRKLNLSKIETLYNNPVLILHGRQDPVGEFIPCELSRYYKSTKLIFIEKCGHYSWIEQPDKVFSLIESFIK